MTYIGITRILALAGVTNFDFVDEESRWKGSEVHRIVQFADQGNLDRESVPKRLRGYQKAHDRFLDETGFIPTHIEFKVQSKALGIRGRIDRAGLMKGKHAVADFKTGPINPAVALQLCLGGQLLNETLATNRWWIRIAIQLKPDGTYSMKTFPLADWHTDLQTALACSRIARWKLKNKLA